jgi:hypothetical protein
VKSMPGHCVAAGPPITFSATPGKAQRSASGVRERTEPAPADGLCILESPVARLREKGVV